MLRVKALDHKPGSCLRRIYMLRVLCGPSEFNLQHVTLSPNEATARKNTQDSHFQLTFSDLMDYSNNLNVLWPIELRTSTNFVNDRHLQVHANTTNYYCPHLVWRAMVMGKGGWGMVLKACARVSSGCK